MADFYELLLEHLHPDRLLHDPRATGAGVRVAIIDSGIDRAILKAKFAAQDRALRPIEGAVFLPDQPEPISDQGRASAPHGTTIADIILTLAPDVEVFSADVFGPRGSCEVESVIRALYWAMDRWNCKVINMSLGVSEARLQPVARRHQLQRAIEDAYYRDVLVFAAAHNEHPLTRSYPAAFAPPLISVDKGLFDDPLAFAYRLQEQVEFQARALGYIGPFATEPATSWAAPHLAGIAARLLSLKPDLKPFEIKALLYWMHRAAEKSADGGQRPPLGK